MKYLVLIPQIIWLLIFPVIGGLVSYYTDQKSYYYISLISLIAMFDIVWWLIAMRFQKLDFITKFFNLLILDIPAYFIAKEYFKRKIVAEKINKGKENMYKKNKKEDILEDEFDLDLLDWEKELLKKKNIKKYEKITNKEIEVQVTNKEIEIERSIIREFDVFVMTKIYEENPGLKNTYQIIQLFKSKIFDLDLMGKMIVEFSHSNLSDYFTEESLNKVKSKNIESILLITNPEEFIVAFKQDRIDICIEANQIIKNK